MNFENYNYQVGHSMNQIKESQLPSINYKEIVMSLPLNCITKRLFLPCPVDEKRQTIGAHIKSNEETKFVKNSLHLNDLNHRNGDMQLNPSYKNYCSYYSWINEPHLLNYAMEMGGVTEMSFRHQVNLEKQNQDQYVSIVCLPWVFFI